MKTSTSEEPLTFGLKNEQANFNAIVDRQVASIQERKRKMDSRAETENNDRNKGSNKRHKIGEPDCWRKKDKLANSSPTVDDTIVGRAPSLDSIVLTLQQVGGAAQPFPTLQRRVFFNPNDDGSLKHRETGKTNPTLRQGTSDIWKRKEDGWKCKTCSVPVGEKETKCPCCNEPKPQTKEHKA